MVRDIDWLGLISFSEKRDKNIMLLSEYHIFPIRNNMRAIFQALTAFTSWQRSDWDTETQISGGVSGENSVFISLSIIITHYRLEYAEIPHDRFPSFYLFIYFKSFFLPARVYIHGWARVYLYIHWIHCHYLFLCLFTLHNQCEKTQGHCNYNHYFHKNNFCVYSHTRRTHLIESISFADDGFTFCHGGCCLISMLWKYGFIFRLISAASTSSALGSHPHYSPSFSLFLPLYLTNITTTSREMMVIGHFGLGQLLTWKRKWLQLGVPGSNLFNSFPP